MESLLPTFSEEIFCLGQSNCWLAAMIDLAECLPLAQAGQSLRRSSGRTEGNCKMIASEAFSLS